MGGDTLFSQEGTTQGDPLAMAMPSPHSLDALQMVKQSRSGLLMMPQQVVVSQASRDGGTVLPREDQPMAVTQTQPTPGNGQGSIPRNWHLYHRRWQSTSRIGTQSFVESFVKQKVSEWVNTIEHLSTIAHTQPHAAYAAFTHGLTSKWTYITRTIPNISDLFSPLEEVIQQTSHLPYWPKCF